MKIYIAVARCPKCGEPAVGYDRIKLTLQQEPQVFPVRCLVPDCRWFEAVQRSKIPVVLELPWEERAD
jgi:hypothetical protein